MRRAAHEGLTRRPFDPFENPRAEAQHRDKQHHAQRHIDAQCKVTQSQSPCGRTDDSAAPQQLYHRLRAVLMRICVAVMATRAWPAYCRKAAGVAARLGVWLGSWLGATLLETATPARSLPARSPRSMPRISVV